MSEIKNMHPPLLHLLLILPGPCHLQRMATKRKAFFPERQYERGWTGGDPDKALTLKPLNKAIPERGFEDAEFIPGLPNRLVADLIWPKVCKNKDEGRDWYFKEALKMRSVSKF